LPVRPRIVVADSLPFGFSTVSFAHQLPLCKPEFGIEPQVIEKTAFSRLTKGRLLDYTLIDRRARVVNSIKGSAVLECGADPLGRRQV